jgi:hypothetical protein
MSIGKNHKTIQKFTAMMNTPGPVRAKSWKQFVREQRDAMAVYAEKSMLNAAREAEQSAGSKDVMCSFDGTWQRRGFSNKNRICTALTGDGKKVVDVETLTTYCQECVSNKLHKEDCNRNHDGSAGMMEPVRMERIFKRSEAKRGLRYKYFLGDGDCKTFKSISESKPPIYQNLSNGSILCRKLGK